MTILTRNPRGFGLSEILISIALFSTAIVVLLGTLTTSNTAIRQTQDRVVAQSIAEQKVEALRNTAYDSIANGTVSTTQSITYKNAGLDVVRSFNVTTTVTSLQTDTLKDITVAIVWSADNIIRRTSLATAVTK